MPNETSLIYAFLSGHVICLHLVTGQDVWRTKIPKSMAPIASILVHDGVVLVGVTGRVHCLDAYTGALRWSNELKGLGFNTVFLGAPGDAKAGSGQASQSAAIQAASEASSS